MTQEEKARAYDGAIKKLRDFYRDYDTVSCLIDVKEELANLFPELKDLEDEKIRKTLEDKQLLLADLFARLPYGVKGLALGSKEDTISSLRLGEYPCVKTTSGLSCHLGTGQFKPYLRPMSSMTEEEKDEMFDICTLSDCSVNTDWEFVGVEIMSSHPRYGDYYSTDYSVIDWLNKNMFDYRGLIPMGLALEAPEDMYKD